MANPWSTHCLGANSGHLGNMAYDSASTSFRHVSLKYNKEVAWSVNYICRPGELAGS
jgi:hypothetical protein